MGREAIFGERKVSCVIGTLTEKQRAILYFLWLFYQENDTLPTVNRLARAMGWKSDNASYEHLMALARRGFLERNSLPGGWKFTKLAREFLLSRAPYPAAEATTQVEAA